MKHYCEWCHQAEGHQLPRLPNAVDAGLHCPECDRPILLVSIRTACQLVQKHPRTIYTWISKEWVRAIKLTDTRPMICYSTLFNPPDAPAETAEAKPNYPRHIVRHSKLPTDGLAVLRAAAGGQ